MVKESNCTSTLSVYFLDLLFHLLALHAALRLSGALFCPLRLHGPLPLRDGASTRGATLMFLPPDSPDLNPIEQGFAKRKALARGTTQRTHETLWTSLGTALSHFSPAGMSTLLLPLRLHGNANCSKGRLTAWTPLPILCTVKGDIINCQT